MRALLPLCLLLAMAPMPAAVVYVKADAAAGGDGTTWASAFRLLSAGLGAAQAGDQVWVAQGTYVPGGRLSRFLVPDGVAVYGGFQGFETAVDQRADDPGLTVLSGEIGDPTRPDDNSPVIALLEGDTHLDTLTVADGYGLYETGSYSIGIVYGGVATRSFVRVRFRANQQTSALYVGGRTTLHGCEFLANDIRDFGSVLSITGDLVITGCVFAGNGAVSDPLNSQRFVCRLSGSGRIDTTVFADNAARAVMVNNGWGGPAYYEQYRVTMVACTFVGNRLDYRPSVAEEPFIPPSYPPWFYGRAYDCILGAVQASQPAAGALNWEVAVRGDPGFADPAQPAGADGRWLSADDGLRLAAGAAARGFARLDAGAADGVADALASDLLGALRPQGGNPEPGAYEIDEGEGNRAPVAAAVRLSAREDTDLRVPLAGSDADGDPLTVRILSLPAHGTLYPTSDGATPSGSALAVGAVIANAQVLYRPAPDDSGSQRGDVTFLLNDGVLDSPVSLAVIDVLAVNDAPTASLPAAATLTQGAATLDITGIAAGGGESQTIAISAVSGDPALLAVAVDYTSPASIGRLLLTPQAGASGSTTVAVTVADDGGTADGGVDRIVRTLAVTVAVADAVDIPAQWVGTVIGVARPFTLAATHPLSPDLIWSITAQPAHGAVSLDDAAAGVFTLTPAAGFSGDDVCAVAARDGLGNAGSATVAITVSGFADARPQPAGDPPRQLAAGATLAADIPWQAAGASLRFTLVGALPAGLQVAGSGLQARIEGLPDLSAVPAGTWLRGGLLAEDPASRSTGWLPLLLRAVAPPQGRN